MRARNGQALSAAARRAERTCYAERNRADTCLTLYLLHIYGIIKQACAMFLRNYETFSETERLIK